MRTTLDIDDDVLAAAKHRAAEERTTAGKVISDLVRQALTQAAAEIGAAEMRHGFLYEDGWYVRPSRGVVVTSELIEQIESELDREDAGPAGRERASGTDG
jgi:hypothetical protein